MLFRRARSRVVPPAEIDVVVPGGAMGAMYTLAGVALVRELECAGVARVRAYYATSAGSLIAVCALCYAKDELIARTLDFVLLLQERARTHWIHETIAAHLHDTLPVDAHTRCTGRLVLSTTRLARHARETVAAFESRDALIDAVVDSCRLPFFSAPARCVLGRHDGYLSPTPPTERAARASPPADGARADGARAVTVTLPYPPAWETVALSLRVVWWATPFMPATDVHARARAALAAGVDLAVPRVALAVDVPPAVVARTRAAIERAHATRDDDERRGGLLLAVWRLVRRLARKLRARLLRGASALTKLELRPRRRA